MEPSEIPVLAGVAGPDRAKRSRAWRRVGIVLLALVVLLSCIGWLGPRDATATDSAGGVDLEVTHPQLTRPGVDSSIEVSVTGADAAGTVTVTLPSEVLDRFGLETVQPAPAAEIAVGDTVEFTFEDMPSDFTILVVGRIPTRATPGTLEYPVGVEVGGAPLDTTVRTWVLP